MLDKGMTHIPDRTEQDSASFHHTAQKGVHFKTEELFISGISYFVFSPYPCSLLIELSFSLSFSCQFFFILLVLDSSAQTSYLLPHCVGNFLTLHISIILGSAHFCGYKIYTLQLSTPLLSLQEVVVTCTHYS